MGPQKISGTAGRPAPLNLLEFLGEPEGPPCQGAASVLQSEHAELPAQEHEASLEQQLTDSIIEEEAKEVVPTPSEISALPTEVLEPPPMQPRIRKHLSCFHDQMLFEIVSTNKAQTLLEEPSPPVPAPAIEPPPAIETEADGEEPFVLHPVVAEAVKKAPQPPAKGEKGYDAWLKTLSFLDLQMFCEEVSSIMLKLVSMLI